MLFKEEVDDDCLDCEYFTREHAHVSIMADHDSPGEDYCELEWECPYMENDDDDSSNA
jgi:hypothetical protein